MFRLQDSRARQQIQIALKNNETAK